MIAVPTCHCLTCNKWFSCLGIASHREMHRRRAETCSIVYPQGDTYHYNFTMLLGRPKLNYVEVYHKRDNPPRPIR